MRHIETHRTERIGWLRAAVLGERRTHFDRELDRRCRGCEASRPDVLIAATAGMIAGALSMAAGEYVSVSSQADTERADLERERKELATEPVAEHAELTAIYVTRGLSNDLASQVATELMAHDALGAHARDELGHSEHTRARPLQAAIASAAAFAAGAILPVMLVTVAPTDGLSIAVAGSSLVLLAVLGGVAAHMGGASLVKGAARVAFWGAVAMGVTALVGHLFGATL